MQNEAIKDIIRAANEYTDGKWNTFWVYSVFGENRANMDFSYMSNSMELFSSRDAGDTESDPFLNMIEKLKNIFEADRNSFPEEEKWTTLIVIIDRIKLSADCTYDKSPLTTSVEERMQILRDTVEEQYNKIPKDQLMGRDAARECIEKFNEVGSELEHTRNCMQISIGCLNDVSKKILELHGMIETYCYSEGLTAICREIGKLRKINDETGITAQIANEISWIMKSTFGYEEFTPKNGEYFDPQLHERRDADNTGTSIIRCTAAGWKKDDKAIIKAFVDTE